MANDLNNCNFIGRLGRDPESRAFPSGDMVCNVSIAVGSTWKDKASGEAMERTEWIALVFTGKLAEIATQYLRKGSKVHISGEFRTRRWADKDGNEKYTTEIRVERMQMLDPKPEAGDRPSVAALRNRTSTNRQPDQLTPSPPMAGYPDMDDDIPFIDPLQNRAYCMAI